MPTYFAKFQTASGKTYHVNADQVSYFQKGASSTIIVFNENHSINVMEDAEDVERLLTGRS